MLHDVHATAVTPDSFDHRRWAAVLARDHRPDAAFVYAVTTTGVYCRPGCPSRHPRRDHVRFFDNAAEASRAGFRPCRRCQPASAVPPASTAIRRAAAYIEMHAAQRVSLARLAAHVGLSPSHLQRQFTRALGVSPREYQSACRAKKFRADLRAGVGVTTAIYEAGYGSPSRVYEAPIAQGIAPASYRRGGSGLEIGFTIAQSHLGRVLIAATAKGICAVKLGDSDGALEAELRSEFSAASIVRDRVVERSWVKAVVDRLAGAHPEVDLPLDVRGTAFQWRVWRELQRIPFGETRAYSEVARAIGRPAAVRAVARACATNPIAVVVPCHRVVGKDGAATGYRWGISRKQKLLAMEGAVEGPDSRKAK